MKRRRDKSIDIETLVHETATQRYIPSAELQPLVDEDERHPIAVAYERRNRDLDPQLVRRGGERAFSVRRAGC